MTLLQIGSEFRGIWPGPDENVGQCRASGNDARDNREQSFKN